MYMYQEMTISSQSRVREQMATNSAWLQSRACRQRHVAPAFVQANARVLGTARLELSRKAEHTALHYEKLSRV